MPPDAPEAGTPGATVLDFLARRFPRVERSTWRERMARGLVLADGEEPLAPDAPFRPHGRLAYFREVEEEPRVPFEERIVHVDERIVVADKPPFLPVTPSGPFVRECLLYRLQKRLADELGGEDLAPAHRLDRHTSGLVLLTRREEYRSVYTGLFARGRIEKTYEALGRLDRRPPQRRWRVVDRLGKGRPFFRRRRVAGAPNARTEVTLVDIETRDEIEGEIEVGRFRLRPVTGKQHQLRVHLAELGFPILGDPLYPTVLPEKPDDFTEPLHLLARSLAFVDPVTGEALCFTSRRDLAAPGVLSGDPAG